MREAGNYSPPRLALFKMKSVFHFHHIADGYSVGFSNHVDLLEDDFPEPAMQIEIDFFHIPWMLDEENPYTDKLITNKKSFFKRMIVKRKK